MRDSIAPPEHEQEPAPASAVPATPAPTEPSTQPPTAPGPVPEEALAQAVSQVEQMQEQLRSIEEQRAQLRATFERASAEADALITQATESYAQEQMRLEAELRSVRERVAGLERFRESRLASGQTSVPSPMEAESLPSPIEPPREQTLGEHVSLPSPNGGSAVPAEDDPPTPPVHEVAPPPATAAPVPQASPPPSAPAAPEIIERPVLVHASRSEPDPSDPDAEAGEGAYEDHWYQVLRRNRPGGRPA